jgi:hypothetical protein
MEKSAECVFMSFEAEVPGVLPMDLGIAYTLFRSLIDPECPPEMKPLTDRYVGYCIEGGSKLDGAKEVFAIIYEGRDHADAIISRLDSFVLFLRRQQEQPEEGWAELIERYDDFTPVIHAIAWCPVRQNEPFDIAYFTKLARHTPSYVFIDLDSEEVKPV